MAVTGDSTGEARLDAAFDNALKVASDGFQGVDSQLRGCSESTHAAWRELTDRVSAQPVIAEDVASRIKAMAADEALPAPFRRQSIAEMHTAAGELLNAHREASTLSTDRFEASLHSDLLPQPASDIGVRTLKRSEAERVMARAGTLPALINLIGRDPLLDAEILGDWGKALLSDEDYRGLRLGAVAKLMGMDGGTERQAAARKTLAAFHRFKVKGLTASVFQVARSRLG